MTLAAQGFFCSSPGLWVAPWCPHEVTAQESRWPLGTQHDQHGKPALLPAGTAMDKHCPLQLGSVAAAGNGDCEVGCSAEILPVNTG